jgi:hypothetical protein
MNTLKSLSNIWLEIANGLSCAPKSIETFVRRSSTAGLPFLTVDLPALAKDVDRSLSTGQLIVSSRFKGSHRDVRPVFLRELFERLYDRHGVLNEFLDPVDLRNLRQLLYVFYKFEMPFTPEQEQEAIEKFIANDASVKTDDFPWQLPLVRKHFRELLPHDPLDIRPHHAGGQTADRITKPQKRSVRRYNPSVHEVFKFSWHFQNVGHYKRWRSSVKKVESDTYPSRLAFVPKDSRGPRTICMEPHETMYFQKGVQELLYEFIEEYSPAKGRINFTDQTINRQLALKASLDRSLATIDLKDASDMVSWSLIQKLLEKDQEWLAVLDALRTPVVSYSTSTTDYNIPLKKFAPMGSALCFPIEAMLFYSICRTVTEEVWVYGDDLVVPTYLVGKIIGRLEDFGLVVNHDKSLFTGYFRESCGGDFYRGHEIGVLKLKSLDMVSYTDFLNLIQGIVGIKVTDQLAAIYEQSSRSVLFRMPRSTLAESRVPGVYYTDMCAASDVFFKRRYNAALQRYERRIPCVKTMVTDESNPSDEDLYFDWLNVHARSNQPETDSLVKEFEFRRSLRACARENLRNLLEPREWSKPSVSYPRNKYDWFPEEGGANLQMNNL